MCYYTVGEAVYEDCSPKPPHMVRCIIFERCLFRVGSMNVCAHPAVKKPGAVLKKHVKDGSCSKCSKITITIRERCVAVPDSPRSEHSVSSEETVVEEERCVAAPDSPKSEHSFSSEKTVVEEES